MDVFRKTIGVLILVLIGVPTLLSIIWTVGITKSVVSPELLSDLPREVIERLPDMVDEVLEEVDREDMVEDANGRAWVKAVVQAETSPKKLLAKIGLLDWLENELSASLKRMGDMLRGDIPMKTIELDLRPLKEALRHEAIKEYLVDLLKTLPECDEDQMEEWVEAAQNPRDMEDLPACRPTDLESAAQAILFVQEHEIEDIPDEVDLLQSSHSFPRRMNLVKSVVSLTYLLFLLPAVILVIAAVIGGTGRGGFMRWMGVPMLISGIIAYAVSSLAKNAIPWAIGIIPETDHYITPFEELMIGKGGEIGMLFTDQILHGVNQVAGVVCIIGIVFFALSYLLPAETPSQPAPKSSAPQPPQPEPAPQPPAQEPVIEAEFIKEEKPKVDGAPGEDKKLTDGNGDANITPKST